MIRIFVFNNQSKFLWLVRGRIWVLGSLLMLLALALAACAPAPTPETVIQEVTRMVPGETIIQTQEVEVEVVVTEIVEVEVEKEVRRVTVDAGYGPVTLDYVPQRIFVDGVQGIEVLAALGVEPVGWTTRGIEVFPDWLDVDWSDSENLGNPPSLEILVSLQPDLIIGEFGNDNAAYEEIAPTFVIRANSYEQSLSQLLQVGELLDRQAEAQAFVDEFNGLLDETRTAIQGQESQLSTAVIYPGREPGILGMWLDQSHIGSILSALGVEHALKLTELTATDLEGDNANRAANFRLVQLGLEKIIDVDPDSLFILALPPDALIAELSENTAWSSLTAVSEGRLYGFDRNLWSRSRGPIGAKLILLQARNALYPDLFPDAGG